MGYISIPEWTAILKEVIPEECKNQRPFVCDGFSNPSECDIIVIGKNPATELGLNWRCFWHDTSGFNYTEYANAYAKVYERRKRRRSKTKERFNRFGKNGFRCIVTNVCCEEGVEKSKEKCDCNAPALRVLLDSMPRQSKIGVFSQGCPASDFVKSYQCPIGWHVHTTDHLHLRTREERWREIDIFCAQFRSRS